MWWCQFIDRLKFETRPSSLLNFGTAHTERSEVRFVVICKPEILKKKQGPNIRNRNKREQKETNIKVARLSQWDSLKTIFSVHIFDFR